MLEDLNTAFVAYLETLRETVSALDMSTEIALHLATVRAAGSGASLDDLNTAYALYLVP